MSLYKRGNSWYYDIQLQGHRYAKSLGPVTKTLAKELLARLKMDLIAGQHGIRQKPISRPRFSDFAPEYLAYYKSQRKARSAKRHLMALKPLLATFGAKRLDAISPFLIEKYKRERREMGRSAVTVNRELACLRNLYRLAIAWGRTIGNPMQQVALYREEERHMRVLTAEEEMQLLAACSETLRPFVITALYTGFRYSELLSLTWGNVDLRQHLITVEAAYAKNGTRRSVPLTRTMQALLQGLWQRQAPHEPLFLNSHGVGYKDPATVFTRAVRTSGIPHIRFHDLRHTFASRLVMAGKDLRSVQLLMGHKSITQTQRYAHLSPGHLREAIQVLDRVPTKITTLQATKRETSA